MILPPAPASHRPAWGGGIFPSLLLSALALSPPARAQETPPAPAAALPSLDQLLAPVALYPDPLLGLVLAASTYPADLSAAASYIAQGGGLSQIEAQPWNDSVKGLAHYPDVVQWMNANPPWTQQLGAAFASQPTDVMNAVQDLRARARAAGALTSTPQQTVVTEADAIAIEPADSDEIYVPLYNPDAVYFAPPPGYWGGAPITFGPPYPMGIWLGFDFDWRGRRLWAGDWYTWRRAHGGWAHPYDPRDSRFAGFAGQARAWHPPANAPRVNLSISRRQGYAVPRPMRGAPPALGPRGGPAYHPTPAPRLRAEELQRASSGGGRQAPERGPERAPRVEYAAPGAGHGLPGKPAGEHRPGPAPKPKAKPPVKRPPPKPEEPKE